LSLSWIPSAISVLRLATALPAGVLLTARDYANAFPLVTAAGLTDFLDGYLARRFGWQSRTGAWLDPVADKVLLTTVFVCLGAAGHVPGWFVALVVGRDALILAMAGFALAFTSMRDFPPSIWGKVSTNLQILAAATQLVHLAGLADGLGPMLAATLALATAGTLLSGSLYFYNGVGRLLSWRRGAG
jgi:cardiolipin synthase